MDLLPVADLILKYIFKSDVYFKSFTCNISELFLVLGSFWRNELVQMAHFDKPSGKLQIMFAFILLYQISVIMTERHLSVSVAGNSLRVHHQTDKLS